MLLQTNSYIVPREKRAEHARLLKRFKQALAQLGCDHFEVYEQVGANWNSGQATGRFVHILRFRDRRHYQDVQTAERSDPGAQELIKDFCALINFPYQQEQGLFAVGFYTSALPVAATHAPVTHRNDLEPEEAGEVQEVELVAEGEAPPTEAEEPAGPADLPLDPPDAEVTPIAFGQPRPVRQPPPPIP